MNPPYDGGFHLEFLNEGLNSLKPGAGCLVCVEPGQWLVQLKDNGKYTKPNSLSEKIKEKIKGHVKSVELNNMNNEFNIRNKTAISIVAVDYNKNYNKIKFECCKNILYVNSIYDCNLIGDYSITKSILNKCKVYQDHMIDHCINLKKYKEYEGHGYYFLRYLNFMVDNLGSGGLGGFVNKMQNIIMHNPVNNTFNSYFLVSCENKPISNRVPISKTGNPCDSVYGTKKELENWKYFNTNNKLPLFVNICLTIDENNNSREYLPWLVDKHYTDKEIYNLLGITKEEQDFIDEVLKRYDASSEFFKNYFGA